MRAGDYSRALPLAERAVAGKVRCTPAHGLLATILVRLGRRHEADALIEDAEHLSSGVADAYDALAYVSMGLGRHDRANRLYRRATEVAPCVPRHWYNLASSERSFGRLAAAEAACDRAIALDPGEYPSYLLRSELRVQTQDENHVEELRRRLAQPGLADRARVFLGYALGKELDDLRQYDEAFHSFADAARTRRRHLNYDAAVDEHKLRRIAEVYSRRETPLPDEMTDPGRYIFIVGLPRSGTTLLERILTNIPGVRSNGETDHFAQSLLGAPQQPISAGSGAAGDVFERAAATDSRAVAARYARLAGGGTHEHVLEKLPLNYLYLGAIHRALPGARLLLVSRAPLDSCFAMYRTLFGEAYPFSYDFADLARYYAAYARLVQHWREVIGEAVHEVQYEALVQDPIGTGSAAARACGLAWADAAIRIEENAAVSLTASAAQVRRPIYGTSSGRWRRYHDHLRPLIEELRRRDVALPGDA